MLRLLMCILLAHAAAHAADSGQWRPAGTGRARRARRACCAEPCRTEPRPLPFMNTAYGRPGSLADPAFDRGGDCGVHGFKCVASFGLYGNSTVYTTGALRNAMLMDTVYPGWVARFYYDPETVPAPVLDELEAAGAELVAHKAAKTMFARFLVAGDPTVDRYIVRDVDSRLGMRERAAVDEWIASGYSVHSMRDPPSHGRPLTGGMWGGVKGALADIEALVATFGAQAAYNADQDFLGSVVYPRVELDYISHDSVKCTDFPNARPFPTRRVGAEHVGMVFSADEAPRMFDMAVFFTGWTAPAQCRREGGWTKG